MKAPLSLVRKVIKEVLEEEIGLDKTEMTEGHIDPVDARDELISVYSDVYKEKYGIRPRWMNWDSVPTEEIEARLNALYDEPGEGDSWDDPYGSAPEPHEADFYPPNAGTVDEPAVASVRSGGRVHLPDEDGFPAVLPLKKPRR